MSRQLNKRASNAQKVEFLKYLENNIEIAKNASDSEAFHRAKEKWIELTNLLNTIHGSHKSVSEWRKYFYDWRKRAHDRYMILKKSMKKEGKNDPKYYLDRLDDLDKRLINILSVEEIEGMSGRSIEPLEPGMLVCSPLHITGSRSDSPVSEPSHSRPVSEVWLRREEKFWDEMLDNLSSSSSEFNWPNSPKALPVRKKRKRHENEDDEDIHFEMKKRKLAYLRKMEEIENKKLNLKIRRAKRESLMFQIMLKKDEREAEEHKMKLQLMKTKLEVLRKQLKK